VYPHWTGAFLYGILTLAIFGAHASVGGVEKVRGIVVVKPDLFLFSPPCIYVNTINA
jgi:hypothetical protein